jgi:hypothetical protein
MFRVIVLVVLVWLAGCVSQFATGYHGKTLSQLQADLGKPVEEIHHSDTVREVRYYWGGGTMSAPRRTTSRATVVGNTAYIQSQTIPGYTRHSPGCLVSFIAEKHEDEWIIARSYWPDRMIC